MNNQSYTLCTVSIANFVSCSIFKYWNSLHIYVYIYIYIYIYIWKWKHQCAIPDDIASDYTLQRPWHLTLEWHFWAYLIFSRSIIQCIKMPASQEIMHLHMPTCLCHHMTAYAHLHSVWHTRVLGALYTHHIISQSQLTWDQFPSNPLLWLYVQLYGFESPKLRLYVQFAPPV